MEEKRDNKEIRVRLHHIDRGNCRKYGRCRQRRGSPDAIWDVTRLWTEGVVPLCDAPYGYCERDCHVREDLTLIVCDKDWNEVLRDGTDRERFPESFPSLDEACNEAWSKVVKVLPHVTHKGFGQWITKQSFLPLSQTEELNWRDSYYEEEASEILSRFTWIGEEYAIFKVTQRHTKCDAQWYEYYAGRQTGRNTSGIPVSSVTSTMTGISATYSGHSEGGATTSSVLRWKPARTTITGVRFPVSWTSSSVTTCPMNRSVTPRNADCARHGKTTTKRTPTITN